MGADAAPEGHVGVIYGNVGTTAFRFAVNDPRLKRLDYVKVRHDTDGVVLAHVTEITRESSLSYDQAADISHGRGSTEGVGERLTANARVVGFRDARGLLQVPRTPFRAGDFVHAADFGLIAAAFGLHDQDGAYLGLVKGYDLPVHLDVNALVQKHVSVLAKTGSGKSYVVGCLMEELIKRGVPIVIVDPHGEHGSLARPNLAESDYPAMRRFGVRPRGYAEHVIEYSPDTRINADAVPLHLDGRGLPATEIADALGTRLTSSQSGILQASVRALAEEDEHYTLEEVLEKVKTHQSNTKWNLVQALENLIDLGIYTEGGTPIHSLVKKDKVSVLNLKGVPPQVQEIVVSAVSRRLFESRKSGDVPPFMLVIEEAHNFCPERGLAQSRSSDELRTIASEGRKFGLGLAVVSQRPAKVDKNVLSQCGTQIVLKVTNPNDVKAITQSVESLSADLEGEIQRLPVGVGLVSHPRFAMPIMVEIRPRETSHGGESVDVMRSLEEIETFLAPEGASEGAEGKEAQAGEGGKKDAAGEAERDSNGDTGGDDEKPDITTPEPAATDAPHRDEEAPFTRVPVDFVPPAAEAPVREDATTAPPPWPREIEAPAPPPEPRPAPRAAPPAKAAPPRAPAPRGPLPEWVEATEVELAAVESADFATWEPAAVSRLADDLAERAQRLRALPAAEQEAAADLLARVERKRAAAEAARDRATRREGSFMRRVLARVGSAGRAGAPRGDEEDAAPPTAPKPRTRSKNGKKPAGRQGGGKRDR